MTEETAKFSECEKDKIIPKDKWQELIDLLEKPKEKGEAPGEVKLDVRKNLPNFIAIAE